MKQLILLGNPLLLLQKLRTKSQLNTARTSHSWDFVRPQTYGFWPTRWMTILLILWRDPKQSISMSFSFSGEFACLFRSHLLTWMVESSVASNEAIILSISKAINRWSVINSLTDYLVDIMVGSKAVDFSCALLIFKENASFFRLYLLTWMNEGSVYWEEAIISLLFSTNRWSLNNRWSLTVDLVEKRRDPKCRFVMSLSFFFWKFCLSHSFKVVNLQILVNYRLLFDTNFFVISLRITLLLDKEFSPFKIRLHRLDKISMDQY